MNIVQRNSDVRDFLASRRARLGPEQVGLNIGRSRRRVPGLRREEVAMLSGVSVEYYARLERGDLGGVSDNVLDAISRALQLDEAERAHLFALARSANQTSRPRRKPQQRVTPGVQRILDGMANAPAFVQNARLDLVAHNRLGHALYAPMLADPVQPANFARFIFFGRRATELFADWDDAADTAVALLRTAAGSDPYDKNLSDLIGELSTRSEEFRTRWATHIVRRHQTGRKRFRHPVVGALDLSYDAMDLSASPGLKLVAYTAEPRSASEDALRLLASWAATLEGDQAPAASATDS